MILYPSHNPICSRTCLSSCRLQSPATLTSVKAALIVVSSAPRAADSGLSSEDRTPLMERISLFVLKPRLNAVLDRWICKQPLVSYRAAVEAQTVVFRRDAFMCGGDVTNFIDVSFDGGVIHGLRHLGQCLVEPACGLANECSTIALAVGACRFVQRMRQVFTHEPTKMLNLLSGQVRHVVFPFGNRALGCRQRDRDVQSTAFRMKTCTLEIPVFSLVHSMTAALTKESCGRGNVSSEGERREYGGAGHDRAPAAPAQRDRNYPSDNARKRKRSK